MLGTDGSAAGIASIKRASALAGALIHAAVFWGAYRGREQSKAKDGVN